MDDLAVWEPVIQRVLRREDVSRVMKALALRDSGEGVDP